MNKELLSEEYSKDSYWWWSTSHPNADDGERNDFLEKMEESVRKLMSRSKTNSGMIGSSSVLGNAYTKSTAVGRQLAKGNEIIQ